MVLVCSHGDQSNHKHTLGSYIACADSTISRRGNDNDLENTILPIYSWWRKLWYHFANTLLLLVEETMVRATEGGREGAGQVECLEEWRNTIVHV